MLRENLIEIDSLNTSFLTNEGNVHAINGIDFTIEKGKILGVVGESGCGKSVTALSIMGLIKKPGRINSGKILFSKDDKKIDLAKLDPMGKSMRAIRGNDISMIFQEPMTSLNPIIKVGNQIVEAIMLHQNFSKNEAKNKAIEMLETVGIPVANEKFNEYPHQLSGGMRQRVMIAMALSCEPKLLIADEPTTALDVTIQAQVLKLMNELQSQYKSAIMFITHDLGVIAQMADEVIVMYLGKIIESAPVKKLFLNPKHPYTQGLLESIPALNKKSADELFQIHGNVPNPLNVIKGCGFFSRCTKAMDICKNQKPNTQTIEKNHITSCWLYE